jgi:signal transduction histidine kinase
MNNELEAFCYSVSHDLRAPLRSIDGFSKAVLEDSRDVLDSAAVEYLARVRAAAHRMDELITALLTLSRLTRAEVVRQRIDVTRMVQELTEDHPGSLASVCFKIQPNMETVADPRLLRNVLDNLLSNAVKFSAKVVRPVIEVGCTPEGTFFVRDNGVGFNPEYSAKLFTPFERLHSSSEYPGSGIGLATVQRIISRHGGHIWAESKEGEGAAFYFTLDSGADTTASD